MAPAATSCRRSSRPHTGLARRRLPPWPKPKPLSLQETQGDSGASEAVLLGGAGTLRASRLDVGDRLGAVHDDRPAGKWDGRCHAHCRSMRTRAAERQGQSDRFGRAVRPSVSKMSSAAPRRIPLGPTVERPEDGQAQLVPYESSCRSFARRAEIGIEPVSNCIRVGADRLGDDQAGVRHPAGMLELSRVGNEQQEGGPGAEAASSGDGSRMRSDSSRATAVPEPLATATSAA